MPRKTKKEIKVPNEAKIVDEATETNLRDKEARAGVVQSFFIDRPLRAPFGWTISQMNRQLKVGGRIYVAPEVNEQVRNVLERYHGEGRDEDELIVYGGEDAPEVTEEPVEQPVEEEFEESETSEEDEDTSS